MSTQSQFYSITQQSLEPSIYCTWGYHTNHYTTDINIGLYKVNFKIIFICKLLYSYVCLTHRLFFQWIRIIWLSGVTCPPTDCCLVEWHVHPQIVVSVNQDNMTEWSWVDMSLHSVILSWFTETTVCGWTCHSTKQQSVGGHVTPWHVHPQTVLSVNQDNMTEWSNMSTHRLLFQWIRIIWLSGVTCPPTDCCFSESG
jgi:hypothetical protein